MFLSGTITAQTVVTLNTDLAKTPISKHIYGHFAKYLGRCIYGGMYIGEGNAKIPNTNGVRNDVIQALKDLKIPNLRWPGGCFADTYQWKDGIGPKANRPKMVNVWWGGVTEDNSFGTHDFLDLCERVGAEPYLAGNLGSGTVKDL
jgi:alpha-L-arabinofuranosidase